MRDVGVHDMHENEEVLERVVGVLAEDDLAQIKTRVLVAGVGGR